MNVLSFTEQIYVLNGNLKTIFEHFLSNKKRYPVI